jgi:hypothetical protein
VADYAETSFHALCPLAGAVRQHLMFWKMYVPRTTRLEVRGYREWHDGFVFQRIINLHKNHGMTYSESCRPDAKDT